MKKIFAWILAAALLCCTGCGKAGETSDAKEVDLTGVYESCQELLPEMVTMDEDTMLNFLGIVTEDCDQAIAATCVNGLRTDEIWLVEAKDGEALERLKALAEGRLEAKRDETVSYAPDQYAVVEKAELLTEGNYLVLLVSPDVDGLKTIVEGAIK